MGQTSLDTSKKERGSAPSRLWRILRWMPITTMLLSIAILITLFLLGGTQKIDAWFLSQLVPPALGLTFLLAIIIYAIVKRRFSKLLIITSLIALLSLSPAILLIKPVAYPASITSTTPSAPSVSLQMVLS